MGWKVAAIVMAITRLQSLSHIKTYLIFAKPDGGKLRGRYVQERLAYRGKGLPHVNPCKRLVDKTLCPHAQHGQS